MSSLVSAQTERRERCRAGEELHLAVSLAGRFSSKVVMLSNGTSSNVSCLVLTSFLLLEFNATLREKSRKEIEDQLPGLRTDARSVRVATQMAGTALAPRLARDKMR